LTVDCTLFGDSSGGRLAVLVRSKICLSDIGGSEFLPSNQHSTPSSKPVLPILKCLILLANPGLPPKLRPVIPDPDPSGESPFRGDPEFRRGCSNVYSTAVLAGEKSGNFCRGVLDYSRKKKENIAYQL